MGRRKGGRGREGREREGREGEGGRGREREGEGGKGGRGRERRERGRVTNRQTDKQRYYCQCTCSTQLLCNALCRGKRSKIGLQTHVQV